MIETGSVDIPHAALKTAPCNSEAPRYSLLSPADRQVVTSQCQLRNIGAARIIP